MWIIPGGRSAPLTERVVIFCNSKGLRIMRRPSRIYMAVAKNETVSFIEGAVKPLSLGMGSVKDSSVYFS